MKELVGQADLKPNKEWYFFTIPTVTAGHPSYAWWTVTTKISQAIQRIGSTSIFARVVFTGMLKKAMSVISVGSITSRCSGK